MELEFHIKFLTLLDFHQIEFFIETQFLGILLHLLDERDKYPFCSERLRSNKKSKIIHILIISDQVIIVLLM